MRALAPLALALCLTTGCASIFTGTKQRITVETDPPRALVIVIGSPVAPILLALEESDAMARKVLGLISPFVSEGARAKLAKLSLAELVAKTIAWVRLDHVPAELIGENVEKVPPYVREKLLDYVGIKEVALSPLSLKLRKGREYAVLIYHEGYGVRMVSIHMRFNWVTLVNVFNVFLGVPIDILTGAWFNLTPTKIRVQLVPSA